MSGYRRADVAGVVVEHHPGASVVIRRAGVELLLTVEQARAVATVGIPAVLPQTTAQPAQTPGRQSLF